VLRVSTASEPCLFTRDLSAMGSPPCDQESQEAAATARVRPPLSSLIALWVAPFGRGWSVKQGNSYYGEYSTHTEAPRLPQRPHYASKNNRSTIVCAACGLARRCTLACMIASRCGSARSWSIL